LWSAARDSAREVSDRTRGEGRPSSSSGGKRTCACISMNPGRTYRPRSSWTTEPAGG
jgi:hypothetical protein